MLDIKFIRQYPRIVEQAAQNKRVDVDIDQILKLDLENRQALQELEALRAKQNSMSAISMPPTLEMIETLKIMKAKIKELETKQHKLKVQLNDLLYQLPNIPTEDTPLGIDETENKIIRHFKEPTRFDFDIKDHLELGEKLNIIDMERAAGVSGARFAYLKNEGVLLELALIQFAFNRLSKLGFELIIPPVLIKQEITQYLGYWQQKGNENYYLVTDFQKEKPDDEEKINLLYLVGTAEHSIVPMHRRELFELSELPKKYVAFSSAFRREAGSYGKDTRGILRVHQFDKVEMVAFTTPEKGRETQFEMLQAVESMLQELELPYQVVQLCTGDLSLPSASTFDIETWIPSQGKYRETHSISTTTDFQSRRLNTKFKDGKEWKLVHILNGTAFAIGRMIIAILENYQTPEGKIKVPHALQSYMGGIKEIG